ncbi:MAG: type II toxin-antitoxin system VapC family toxin [Burkholderiales bacterium]
MLYLDTSFLVPYFIFEESSEKVEKYLLGIRGQQLAVSAWTSTEFVSAVGLKVRRKELDEKAASDVLAAFRLVGREYFTWLPVATSDFNMAAEFLEKWKLGLRAGNALHLAIARSSGAKQLLTLDKKLLDAAKSLRIPASTGIHAT